MNEFDLEKCIAGEPVMTKEGEPMTFVAFLPQAAKYYQLVMLTGVGRICSYSTDGKCTGVPSDADLIMAPTVQKVDLSKLPIDTLVRVSGKRIRCFSGIDEGKPTHFLCGMRSKTIDSQNERMCCSALEILPQEWRVNFGIEPPIPDGLEFEHTSTESPRHVQLADIHLASIYPWHLIAAYRLTGKLLPGWELP